MLVSFESKRALKISKLQFLEAQQVRGKVSLLLDQPAAAAAAVEIQPLLAIRQRLQLEKGLFERSLHTAARYCADDRTCVCVCVEARGIAQLV